MKVKQFFSSEKNPSSSGITKLILGVLLINLIIPLSAQIVYSENFDGDVKDWEFIQSAKIANNALEITSQTTSARGEAKSPWFKVKRSTWYELSYTVRGIKYPWSNHLQNFMVWPMISYRQIPLVDANTYTQCLFSEQTKTVTFQSTPIQDTMRLWIFVLAPGAISIDNITLKEIPAPQKKPVEVIMDMQFQLGSGVFEPSEAESITGILKLNNEQTAAVDYQIVDKQNKIVTQQTVKTAAGNMNFSSPVPPVGSAYTLKVQVKDASGKILGTAEQKLNHHKHRSNQVTFRDDGMAIVDGKPFFMIAHWWFTRRGDTGGNVDWWYENDLDAADDMVFLRKAGFNTLLVRTHNQVQLAWERGLKSIIEYPHKLPKGSPHEKKSFMRKFKKENKFLSNHPGMLAYFGPDEPMVFGFPLDEALASSAMVREADPYHPIFYNESPTGSAEEQARYAKMGDIIGRDIYPVPASMRHGDLPEELELAAVGAHTDICHESVYYRKPCWMILQAYAWLHIYGGRNVKPVSEIKDCVIQYPNYIENRFMAYNAIIHGATGVMYHYLGYSVHIPEDAWVALRNVLLELEYMHDILASRAVKNPEMQFKNDKVKMLVKKYNNQNYYLIANETKFPQTVDFSNCPETKLNVLFEKDPIQVTNGKFTLQFQPWEVKVMSEAQFKSAAEVHRPGDFGLYSDFPKLRGKQK